MVFVKYSTTHLKELILIFVLFKQIADNNNLMTLSLYYDGSGFIKLGDKVIESWKDAKQGLENIQNILFEQTLTILNE